MSWAILKALREERLGNKTLVKTVFADSSFVTSCHETSTIFYFSHQCSLWKKVGRPWYTQPSTHIVIVGLYEWKVPTVEECEWTVVFSMMESFLFLYPALSPQTASDAYRWRLPYHHDRFLQYLYRTGSISLFLSHCLVIWTSPFGSIWCHSTPW